MPNFAKPAFRELGVGYHQQNLKDCGWNCDGNYLGTAGLDKQVKIGQLDPSGAIRAVHTIPSNTHLTQIAWHPTEPSRFCIAGVDKSIELWDVRASRAASKIPTLGGNLNIAWSPEGKYISVGNSLMSLDSLVVVDVELGKWFKRAKFGFEIERICWSADSAHLLVATGEGNIDVLSVDAHIDNQEMRLFDSLTAHTSNCSILRTDSGFQRMAAGSADHTVSLWDLDDLICHHTHAFEHPVRFISFSGDGKHVAVAPEGSVVFILDSDSAEVCGRAECGRLVSTLAWHPRLPLLAVGLSEGKPDPRTHAAAPPMVKLISFPER